MDVEEQNYNVEDVIVDEDPKLFSEVYNIKYDNRKDNRNL